MSKTIYVIGILLLGGLLSIWLLNFKTNQEVPSEELLPQNQHRTLAPAEPSGLHSVTQQPLERVSLGEHASTNGEVEQPAKSEDELDRSDWGINEWNMERLGRYEDMFLEKPTRGASRLLLTQSIAIILNAQGRAATREEGVRSRRPNNDGTNFGFTFNNWLIDFGPGEFPEYEKVLPMWEQGDRKLRDGEKLIEIDEDLRLRILDRAAEARILLEAQLR